MDFGYPPPHYVKTERETTRETTRQLFLRAAQQQTGASPVTAVVRGDRKRERSFSGLRVNERGSYCWLAPHAAARV